MREITATEAARNFSELLDAIEHHGGHFTIVRHAKAIAEFEPARPSLGKDAKALLRRHRPDREWIRDLEEVREAAQYGKRTASRVLLDATYLVDAERYVAGSGVSCDGTLWCT